MNAPISGVALAIVIVGLALSTFLTRTSFLLAGQRLRFGHHIEVALRYAPVCTLVAIIAPNVLLHQPGGDFDFSWLNPRLIGVVAAGAVAGFLTQYRRLPGFGNDRLYPGAPLSLTSHGWGTRLPRRLARVLLPTGEIRGHPFELAHQAGSRRGAREQAVLIGDPAAGSPQDGLRRK